MSKPKLTSEIFNAPPPEFAPVDMDVYSPTRLDYIASKALQGLVSGRSEKDRRIAPRQALVLAQELIDLIDSA